MPVRDSQTDPFYIITQGDSFMGMTVTSDITEIAKDFIDFYFSDVWYPDYINSIGDESTMINFPKEKDSVLMAENQSII